MMADSHTNTGKQSSLLLVTIEASSPAQANKVIAELKAHPNVVRVVAITQPKKRR